MAGQWQGAVSYEKRLKTKTLGVFFMHFYLKINFAFLAHDQKIDFSWPKSAFSEKKLLKKKLKFLLAHQQRWFQKCIHTNCKFLEVFYIFDPLAIIFARDMYTFLESVRQGAPDEPIKMPKLVFFDPMGVSGNRNWSAKINFWAVGKKSKIYF